MTSTRPRFAIDAARAFPGLIAHFVVGPTGRC